jgi:hypothetical protein
MLKLCGKGILMDDSIIEQIDKINEEANNICKERGYLISIPKWSTQINLEAVARIYQRMKEGKDGV